MGRMRALCLLLLLAALLTTGAGCDRLSGKKAGGSAKPSVEDLLMKPYDVLGGDRAALLAKLGKPQKEATEAVKNAHDDTQTDTLRTLLYPGLEVRLYEVKASGESFLVRVTLSKDHPDLIPGLKIGMSRDEVVGVLGAPAEGKDTTLEYRSEATEDAIQVLCPNGKLAKVVWVYYVD